MNNIEELFEELQRLDAEYTRIAAPYNQLIASYSQKLREETEAIQLARANVELQLQDSTILAGQTLHAAEGKLMCVYTKPRMQYTWDNGKLEGYFAALGENPDVLGLRDRKVIEARAAIRRG